MQIAMKMETNRMKNRHGWSRVILITSLLSILITQSGFAGDADTTMTKLGNATYAGIEDEPVSLSQGRWEGAAYVEGGASRPSVGLIEELQFTGDLDADGEDETVAMLWQSSAGTGSNIYIAVMKSEADGYQNISTALLGDRVKLRGGKIESGQIILDVLQAGENDAMCCPTMLATRSWNLKDGQLVENEMHRTGKLSLGAIEGSNWLLVRMNLDQPVPEGAEVTLAFEAGRISGKSACNRYSADIKEGDNPGDILIGPAMGTRMACPEPLMEVETQYLELLAKVTGFSFHVGQLALNGRKDDGTPFSMLFSATETDTP
jgi:heat shock protein HslJ